MASRGAVCRRFHPNDERREPEIDTLAHIRSYYEALNTGDVDLIASHFTDDATHYYTRLGPHRGREIAENARWGIDNSTASGGSSTGSPTATRR